MRRFQMIGRLVLLTCLLCCTMGKDAAAEPPLRTEGEIVIEGAAMKFQTEYWGDGCMVKDDVLTASGMHDAYYDVMRRINDATSTDELRSLWIPESFKQMPEEMVRTSLARNIENRAAGKRRRRDDQNIYMSVMTEYNGQKDLFIMVSAPRAKPNPEGFNIQSISFRDGQWKYSPLALSDHPVRKELQLGAWKQFGSPVDIGDPENNRRAVDRHLASTRAAATQSAKPPSSPSPK